MRKTAYGTKIHIIDANYAPGLCLVEAISKNGCFLTMLDNRSIVPPLEE